MPLPPKPKGKPDDLAEVERALSVLQGRHPEHERARREDAEARTRRAATIDQAVDAASSEARSRYLRVAAVAAPVVLLIGFFALLGRREMNRRANVEKATDTYRAFGFSVIEASSPSATGALEVTVEPGCILAVSTDAAPITITRPGGTTEGPGPRLFCTCTAEHVGLASTVSSSGGLVLMRAEAAALGGSRAFAFAPFKPGSTLAADDACSEASLDAWIEAKRYPAASGAAPAAGWLASPEHAPLRAAGFLQVQKAAPSAPFAVAVVPKESCLVATSSVPSDRLGLRLTGGETPLTGVAGAFARCAQAERTVVVSREGAGELVVLVAPAAAVGGMQGVREIAKESGLSLAATAIPAADRPWDATLILAASQIPEATITTGAAPDVPADKESRIAALSFETPNALTPETPAETFSYCEPPLDAAMRQATCVFSGPQRWRTEAGAESVGGIARARFPFWLFAMQHVSDPRGLQGITQLLALARRLGRDGFVPTTLEALTELPTGVEVLGRTGEDAVVAVGVAPSAPWVYPLTDGPAWALDDAPRIVTVHPLEKVTLSASIKARDLPPKASRRTVVFRRQKR
jgi:hypothetical protein